MKKELHEYMSKIGKRGGKARLLTMTKQERSERARAAINARWVRAKETK